MSVFSRSLCSPPPNPPLRFPFPPSFPRPAPDPVRAAEQELEHQLDTLEDRGVLQRVNRMSLTELLNPDNERDTEQATVQDIYDAVSAARLAQENSDVNGGDDDEDDDADITWGPAPPMIAAAALSLFGWRGVSVPTLKTLRLFTEDLERKNYGYEEKFASLAIPID
ncbi:hypothetical protein C8R46DRAFT_1313843 [Mycena filopes]|nr:hypothetical protein C8R46DRAFT_1313843 [Mycena filopes]